MFTELLPSQHGARFHTMAYRGATPTIAELATAAGHHTEIATRNSIFDGSLPGVTRGFQASLRRISRHARGLRPLALMLALSKPRFRRQGLSSGFFHPTQRARRAFVTDFARAMAPADEDLLSAMLGRLGRLRRANRQFFLFANLYDIHAPYPPASSSIFRPWTSLDAIAENLTMPFVLPALGSHRYLEADFELSERSRQLLLRRHDDAIALMDGKLERFWVGIEELGLLEDTLIVVVSDHDEAFGEYGLYLHDASVYETHLHVPLYVHHPRAAAGTVSETVSTRDLFGLMRAAIEGPGYGGTLLDPEYRVRRGAAFAEHFHYPHAPRAAARYRQDLAAVVVGRWKLVLHPERVAVYDLAADPTENGMPVAHAVADFLGLCGTDGSGSVADAVRGFTAGRAATTIKRRPSPACAAAPACKRKPEARYGIRASGRQRVDGCELLRVRAALEAVVEGLVAGLELVARL